MLVAPARVPEEDGPPPIAAGARLLCLAFGLGGSVLGLGGSILKVGDILIVRLLIEFLLTTSESEVVFVIA